MKQQKKVYFEAIYVLLFTLFFLNTGFAITPYESYKSKMGSIQVLPFLGTEQLVSDEISKDSSSQKETRTQIWKISTANSGSFIFSIRRPAEQTQPLPVIALFAGFQTGKKSLDLIKPQSSTIVVSYEYPAAFDEKNLNFDLEKLRPTSLQIAQLIAWLQTKSWVDSKRINLVAISFGGVFVPLAIKILQDHKINPSSVTLAYTGADISKVIAYYFRQFVGNNEVKAIETIASLYLWDIEPFHYLPTIESDTLIVLASEEKVFPEATLDLLINTVTAPKTLIKLPGPHIQPDRQDLIDNLILHIENWLRAKKHI